MRRCLERTNNNHSQCIPVMVAMRGRAEIETDIQEYERRGALVYTIDDLDEIIGTTFSAPRSDTRFVESKPS